MATKVKSYRINITDDVQKWDVIVIDDNWWMTTQHLWTSASLDIWTTEGKIPILWENWKLPDSTISSDAMQKSVYDLNCKQLDVYDYRNFPYSYASFCVTNSFEIV